MLTASSIATVLGAVVVCYAIIISGGNRKPKDAVRYSIVIDGGSKVSRIHVFGYGISSIYASMKSHPGLSAYSNDPEGACVALTKLLEFAKGGIRKGSWMKTEVRLIATAKTRFFRLPSEEKILLQVSRRVLTSSGFKFREEWASVISGSDEARNAWVVTQFGPGTLGGDHLNSTGVVEVIQASLRVDY